MDTRLPHKVIPSLKRTAKPWIVIVLGVVIAGCGQSFTGELVPMPHDDPEPAEQLVDDPSLPGEQLDSGWVETWESAQLGPRDQQLVYGDQGAWGGLATPLPSEDCGNDCWSGWEVSVVPGKQLLLRSRIEAQYSFSPSAMGLALMIAGLGNDLMKTVPGGIPLTPQTVMSARFECEVYFRNPPSIDRGETAEASITVVGNGFKLIYRHQASVPRPEAFIVSDYFSRRLYDDLAEIAWLLPEFPESPRIQYIAIITSVSINPSSGTAETAEVTCYVDDVKFTEE